MAVTALLLVPLLLGSPLPSATGDAGLKAGEATSDPPPSPVSEARTCVDEGSFQERVLREGPQEPPLRLNCPQGGEPLWLKDCEKPAGRQGEGFLDFSSLGLEDQGNYTCVSQGNSTASFTTRLIVKASLCSRAPDFRPDGDPVRQQAELGSAVTLNCTALLGWDPADERCDRAVRWRKDGRPLSNHTVLFQNTSFWPAGDGLLTVSALLEVVLRDVDDFGLFSCTLRNASATFSLMDANRPSHTAAVAAAFVVLILLAVAAVVYCKCHLNILLWYKNSYGEYELNDGKLFDAYVSYVNNDYDRKFVSFILKPHLENKHAHKVHLNGNDILPGSEPSAELLMNISRSRRLIVLLSYAYLEQEWCTNNFRQGLLHLLELCQQPILILLEGQAKRMRPEVRRLLDENQHRLSILTWRHNSVTPSSVFWKELALAMPRKLPFPSQPVGDPQTVLQDDKDPMLTLEPDYLDGSSDTDPAGDLGVRLPVFRTLAGRAPGRAPVLPAAPLPMPADPDLSDLASRNYGTRSDFYRLVTEKEV